MSLSQIQNQKQIITPAMQQSLNILQFPALSLYDYLTEITMDNPIIDIEQQMPHDASEEIQCVETEWGGFKDKYPTYFDGSTSETDGYPKSSLLHMETFSEYLLAQLYQNENIPISSLSLCRFIVESLDERGYLDESVEDLAEIIHVSSNDLLQALYLVQSLSPTGVGARDLQECLLLQLTESSDLNAYTLAIVCHYLPLLAKGKIHAIAVNLKISDVSARQYCDTVRKLNPIPSQGFSSGALNYYIVPDAKVLADGKNISIQYNNRIIPQVHMNQEYIRLMQSTDDAETRSFLDKKLIQANKLTADLKNRETTLIRIMKYVLAQQKDYILGKSATLQPLTLTQTASDLLLSPSTVSRAVKDKYLDLPSKGVIPLKSLFSSSVGQNQTTSKQLIMDHIRRLIQLENKERPLSDEMLCSELERIGIFVSRRTVASYRQRIGIPTVSARRLSG